VPTRHYRVELTRGAEADLESLYDYTAEHRSPDQARRLLDGLLERVAALETHPERGSVPREIEALGIGRYRQLSWPPYRLIYRIAGPKVIILVIADGRRDLQTLLERRLLKP
jgi:toxin ParE1/3/4